MVMLLHMNTITLTRKVQGSLDTVKYMNLGLNMPCGVIYIE